jgi:AcrR family transcriptional regulator
MEGPMAESARDRIRTATVELMARKGVSGTTTQDIARRAGCSQAAIYKHWEGKEILARELFDEAQEALTRSMEEGASARQEPAERVISALQGLVDFARSRPSEYAFLFQVFHSDYARWLGNHRMPRDIVVRELHEAAERKAIPDGDLNLKAACLLGMAVRTAFFERQGLIQQTRPENREAFWRALAAVVES